MDPTVVQYVLFVLAALILIWAVIALNKRLYRRGSPKPGSPTTWMKLDTRRPEAREDPSPDALFDGDAAVDEEEIELHARARQNGHHAESQKPQL